MLGLERKVEGMTRHQLFRMLVGLSLAEVSAAAFRFTIPKKRKIFVDHRFDEMFAATMNSLIERHESLHPFSFLESTPTVDGGTYIQEAFMYSRESRA